jgi:hypothetical protein
MATAGNPANTGIGPTGTAIAAMLNGDPERMINSWAASDDITLFGA